MPSKKRPAALSRVQPAKLVLVSRRLTVRSVARAIGYDLSVTSEYINGRRRPSARFRRRLADYLDLPEQALFHDDQRGAA